MDKSILNYAKTNAASFMRGGISSNEIRFFDYDGKKYVLKTPIVTECNTSPFWLMMKKVFNFSFEKQNLALEKVYGELADNPHIRVPKFVAADYEASVFEYVKGTGWDKDEFPIGDKDAYRLGQYVGCNHRKLHRNCGILGAEDCADFFKTAFAHMEDCIDRYWCGDSEADRKVRTVFDRIKGKVYRRECDTAYDRCGMAYESAGYSLIMTDMSADQFLYDGGSIAACVDLDAYVIGPIEWELSFLKMQVRDWKAFKEGYETYRKMPDFEGMSEFFYLLMAVNSYDNKDEIEAYWADFF